MPSDRAGRRPFEGFNTYADDTPREVAPIDAPEAPLMAGWSETPPWRRTGDEEEPGPAWPKIAAVAGAAMGVAAAVAVGWSAMRRPDAPPVAEPATAIATAKAPLQVVLTDPPPPPPVPRTAKRMEVLPEPEPATPPRVRLARAMIPVLPEPGAVVTERPDDPLPAPSVGEAAQDAAAVVTPVRRFNDCADAPTRAMALVCRDMRLAEADRRMKRAYRAALAAGVPAGELARDQADWLEVREDAAQVSRRAVADIYRQRTRELRAMADERLD